MKDIFITKLVLEKIRNLSYAEIPLSEDCRKHLIFTGKNGSGKTTVLDALSKALDQAATTNDPMEAEKNLQLDKKNLDWAVDTQKSDREISEIKKRMEQYQQRIDYARQGFVIKMNVPLEDLRPAFEAGEFIIAYYSADRIFRAEIPKHVEKIALKNSYTSRETPRTQFVKYLLDLMMTQALAAANGKTDKAQKIQKWFDDFEKILKEIFEDPGLRLEFDEDSFRFYIQEDGKEAFDFNMLSSGYAAILDIVVDLMIRMEHQTNRHFQYDLPGIVLIDEIETHLHLELQKKILSFLTTLFPNIQFIVSTHSPFILNSLENAVIYDLEKKMLVKDGLSDIPYDGIVEGYFGASVLSEKLKEKFDRYKSLVQKKELTDRDYEEIANLEMYLDEIPDYLALGITTEYQRLKLDFLEREEIDG